MVREERTIEVTVISATDLKKVKKLGREQKCYAVVYIYPARRETTPTDHYGGINPIWNATLKVACYETDIHPATTSSGTAAESSSSPSPHMMTVEIYSHGGGIFHKSDKLVGCVTVPLQRVASAAKAGDAMPAFEVHLPTGEVEGSLNLLVKLGAKRELGEYEDLSAAVLPSYSNDQYQEAPASSFPPASGKGSSIQPGSYSTQGQSSYGNYPPTYDYPAPPPNKSTSAAEDDVVTGYPVPGPGYAFAPLGQLPMQSQVQNVGPYAALPPERTRRQMRREQRACRRGRRRGPILMGIMVLQGIFAPMTLGMGHRRRPGASNEAQAPLSSSSQPGKSQDPTYR